MKVIRAIADLQLDRTKKIGFVPTMGAFHEGHLHLMRKAREISEAVVVSLFVNPTQFRAGEDFERYPRDEAMDFALAEQQGVDVMFAPTTEEMYGSQGTTVHVPDLTEIWEGAFRPGHFDGVTTVVAKLLNIVRPDIAVFGLKDYQQCLVIRKMVQDLNFPLRLHFEETVREPDGLAMSSRNKYLKVGERSMAPMLQQELRGLAKHITSEDSEDEVQQKLNGAANNLAGNGFNIDYLELVDGLTLESKRSALGHSRLIVAARLGSTRLIDNIALGEPFNSNL